MTRAREHSRMNADSPASTDRAFGRGDIRQHGGSPDNSAAENKTALQAAITAIDDAGGGVVTVPADCPYGRDTTDQDTHPDFTGVSNDMLVVDYSPGSTYTPPASDGAQVHYFWHTVNASSGQHDGNGFWLRGAWHPYLFINNDYELPTPRTVNDNFRANVFFGAGGEATWNIGTGSLTSDTATAEELKNFYIGAWGTSAGDYVAMIVTRIGNWLFNTDSNEDSANYHFKARAAGYLNGLFESLTTTCRLVLRNSVGEAEDVELQNVEGAGRMIVGDKNFEGDDTGRWSAEYLSVKDGITAPGAVVGFAQIYVDEADGDLKVKFGDGTTKTIVVDT